MNDFLPSITAGNENYIKALQENSNPANNSEALNGMEQADFLLLLTTQMQNQDPSKPMDATDFVTDLTQMGQLEATNDMNASILAMTASFNNLQTMQGASLIGKNVQIEGDKFSYSSEQPSSFSLNTDEPFIDITIVISDDDGIVKELSYADFLSDREKASWDGVPNKSIEWDGLDDVGAARGDGVFSITAYGTDSTGETKSINTVVGSRVNTVGIGADGSMTLTLATGEKVAMDTVREISG
ncbi:Flagellar basal-body rod modification protein FlgD [hydrothermal vent metagenome]|uniref:Flagellar basal-body rod modification protein FlgD n=2 Tax=hydrothermal vent metagenome TaxID=652676 RepID=A0A3B0VPY9_9ZZZZ